MMPETIVIMILVNFMQIIFKIICFFMLENKYNQKLYTIKMSHTLKATLLGCLWEIV